MLKVVQNVKEKGDDEEVELEKNLAEKRHSASNCENGFTGIVIGAGESVPDAGNRGKEESSGEVYRMSERER